MLNGLYNLDVRFVVKQFYMIIYFKFPTVLISNPFSDCLLLLPYISLQVKLTQTELVTFVVTSAILNVNHSMMTSQLFHWMEN